MPPRLQPSNADTLLIEAIFLGALFLGAWICFQVVSHTPYPISWTPPYDTIGGADFIVYWSAGLFLQDYAPYLLYDLPQFQNFLDGLTGTDWGPHPWLYPPVFMPIVQFLALFPYGIGYAIWMFGTAGLLVWSMMVFLKEHGSSLTFKSRALVIGAALLSPAACLVIGIGQNTFLSAALMIGALGLLDRRPVVAGILIGALVYKPQLGVLFPLFLLIEKKWVSFIAAAVTVCVLVGGSIVFYGMQSWEQFFVTMPEFSALLFDLGSDRLVRLLVVSTLNMTHLMGASYEFASLVHFIFAALVCVAGFWAIYKSGCMCHKAAIFLTISLLVLPYALAYELLIVSIAGVLVVMSGVTKNEKLLLIAVWFLPFYHMFFVSTYSPIGPLPVTQIVLVAFLAYLVKHAISYRVSDARS